MWIVAGILLGIVVLGVIAGFHVGPHAHLFASVAGVVAAAWLLVMAFLGESRPLLYVLLGADVTITGLMGFAAWRVLKTPEAVGAHNEPAPSVEGDIGTALGPLNPEGIVRVGGEEWSAVSLNGPVRAGGKVQVINANGVRLEVWGEENPALAPPVNKDEGATS
ncbi:MAG: NfeD family protein [Acidimicrobiales bacterium]|jgi:membrane-bound ClpP family serine protease